jgi:general secretion pathway protein H
MTPTAYNSSTARGNGFTLIEIVVVLLLITIVIGMVGLGFIRDRSSEVREEAERLALMLQAAQQEATMQGQVLALRTTTEGYAFLRLSDQGRFVAIERDELLGPRKLTPPITIEKITIEGLSGTDKTGLLLEPSGALPPFTITVSAPEATWEISGLANGTLRVGRVESHAR